MSGTTTVSVFIPSDISSVRGSTEPHYLVRGLAETYDVHLFAPVDPEVEGITHHSMPSGGPIPALLWYNFLLLPVFILHGIRARPDVVYTYKGFTFAPWLLSRVLGGAWIADLRTEPTSQDREIRSLSGATSSVHRLYYDLCDLLYRVFLPRTSLVFAVSEELVERLVADYDLAPDDVVLLPLAVDTDRFDPSGLDGSDRHPIDVVYLGSITPYRGLDLCLEALAMGNLREEVTLHIIGTGDDDVLEALHRREAELEVVESVVWHGYVKHAEVPDHLAEMDAGVSPLPNHDAYRVMSPAKVYEYLAMGLPVVASDLPAHRRLVTEGESGFLFDPGDVASLSDALGQLTECSSQEWSRLASNARQVAIDNDWRVRTETVRASIERLV